MNYFKIRFSIIQFEKLKRMFFLNKTELNKKKQKKQDIMEALMPAFIVKKSNIGKNS